MAFSMPATTDCPVAQTCRLSVSLEIVAGRINSLLRRFFFLAPRRRSGERTEERGGRLLSPTLSSIGWKRGSVALRLSRAALYRRFLTCHALFQSHVLPITNRRLAGSLPLARSSGPLPR